MRVPVSWLGDFIDVSMPIDDLAARLSLAGLAVEQIIQTGDDVSGVVVGEVRAMREHANADSLMLVVVADGDGERDIVCGARNYTVGDRVPLARPGASLPGGMAIAQRKVRGEVSDGMLCSARELAIAEDHSGILILDGDAPVGGDIVEVLALRDTVLDIDVTPNRPDCLSVLGIAREIAALYGLALRDPLGTLSAAPVGRGAGPSVTIEDHDGCARYLGQVFDDVRIGPSPWWMRRRILLAGMRPISSVVDVTNYVLLERGQPLHAFDLDTLVGESIVVRRPRDGETILTLDGQHRALASDDVVICDGDKPVAIAGIMGGAETEVTDNTRRILLESAVFNPRRIARAARRLELRSEASVRFERGADPCGVAAAAARATELLEAMGAAVGGARTDVVARAWSPPAIALRTARAHAVIGVAQTPDEMRVALQSLGCSVTELPDGLQVSPPSWRPDILIEEDLIEEVARLYGYERVPEQLPSGARTGGLTHAQGRVRIARAALLGAGLSEAQTLTMLPPSVFERLGLPDGDSWRNTYRITNPVSEDESILRPSLVPGLLLAAQRNASRRVLPVCLFEIGTTIEVGESASIETLRAAVILTGPAPTGWHGEARALDFYDAKAAVTSLLSALGCSAWEIVGDPAPRAFLHPGRAALIRGGSGGQRGFIAELHPRVAEALALPARVAIAEIDLAPLLAAAGRTHPEPLPRFPAIERDIALVVPDTVSAVAVQEVIARAAGALLESLDMFDVYRGEPIPEGSRSLALSLRLRDPARTLTDADADAAHERIVEAAREAGWTLRD